MFKVQNKDINIHPYGSSHPKMFREICALKNFIKVQGKTPAMASLFQWTYLQAVILQYNKGAMAANFTKHIRTFLQNTCDCFSDCFCPYSDANFEYMNLVFFPLFVH